MALLRFWGLVLSANLVGTAIFAGLLSIPGLFDACSSSGTLRGHRRRERERAVWPTVVKAILSGWLIALMIWLLPGAKSARLFVILLLTYVVSVGRVSRM